MRCAWVALGALALFALVRILQNWAIDSLKNLFK